MSVRTRRSCGSAADGWRRGRRRLDRETRLATTHDRSMQMLYAWTGVGHMLR